MRNLVQETDGEVENNSDENNVSPTVTMPRIVNLLSLITDKIRKNKVFYSFELFPIQEDNGAYQRFFAETSKYSPLFYALTWHVTSVSNDYLSLRLLEKFPCNTLLHIAAKGLKRNNVEIALKKALDTGITNIFALRGDASEDGDFPHAVDLVTFIRSHFGAKFCICVAGYPQMHPESRSKELDLFYLKKKVDAGADFIITQFFFESKIFIDFVKDCRRVGITVPILPGIFPIPHYGCLTRMANVCNVKIPSKLLDHLRPIKDNDEMIYNFGVELASNIITDIIKSGTAHGFHLFTLNRVSMTADVCNRLKSVH